MGVSGQEPGVQRWRATPLLIMAGLMLTCAVALFVVNLDVQRTAPVYGWLPCVGASVVTGLACRRVAAITTLTAYVRRMWRMFSVICVVVVVALIGDAWDSVVDPLTPPDQHSSWVSALYLLSGGLLLWALMRLPVNTSRRREHLLRFSLDATTVAITVAVFVWYFALRNAEVYADLRTVVPAIVLSSVGLIGAMAFLKRTMNGLGELDRRTVHTLTVAVGAGAVGGVLPLVLGVGHPGITGAHLSVPLAMFVAVIAADRQRRIAGRPTEQQRPRSFSVIPYAAVAATDGLLLVVGRESGTAVMAVAAAAVSLTGLVVVRQLTALRDNSRLLRRVDANLLELSRYQERLTHRATHDELTGLANRSLFELKSRVALGNVEQGELLSLALIDLDDFKAVNDRLGHTVGDALLVVVADRLRECVRNGDVVARLGGDEFGLLLRGLHGDEATDVLNRIGDALSRPVHAAGHNLLVRASIGLSEAWPGAAPQELLRRADLAMYAAKERGKSRHAVYDAELERHQAVDAQLGAELRQAFDRGEFFLVYQPIVRLPDGEWTGMEALVRWRHPERGLVGPDVFIPIAERTGLIVPIGDWILRTACDQAAEWLAEYGTRAPGEIGVNVSARQLREPGFAADVADALASAALPAGRLMVEVTETAVFDGGVALDTLRAVADLGVGVALDDFGTGHSSLGLLRICPADTLKVDKSFVDDIGGATEEAVIATALIQISNGLHLQAVAEGVETAEQAETLHRLGYRFAQGYHFSRPLSAEQVRARLDADREERPTLTV